MTQPTVNYDEISDTLYMSFIPAQRATGIELNEHILLRIDKESSRAIGCSDPIKLDTKGAQCYQYSE